MDAGTRPKARSPSRFARSPRRPRVGRGRRAVRPARDRHPDVRPDASRDAGPFDAARDAADARLRAAEPSPERVSPLLHDGLTGRDPDPGAAPPESADPPGRE